MGYPKFDKLVDRLKKGKSFSLTREQYRNLTGADTPQSKSYTENKSAMAKRAKAYGFRVEVIPEQIKFIKL